MEKWFQDKSFSTKNREQGIKARKIHRDIKARKMHRDIKARKMHRAFGVLLAVALVFQTVPFNGTAVSASESSGGGLCEHHRSHTPDCGYIEEEPGHACTHEHTEDCYRTVEEEDGSTTKELDCHHVHDESCGYREAAEGSPCTFACEICNEGTDGTPEDKTDGNEIKDGDSENPGTENGDETEEPDASLSDCKGKDIEDSMEDAEENADQPEDTGLCKHHPEHDDTCGYQPVSEDGEGSQCTYECRICPIEKLIAALPDAADIRPDNTKELLAQLEEILTLYRELTEDEQEQIDLSRCYELQEALDEANDPTPLSTGDVDLYSTNTVTLTEAECSGGCQGHKITQSYTQIVGAKILVESGTHNITFSGLNLSSAAVGIMPGGTMNLTLVGTNKIVGSGCGFYVPVGATLVITEQSTGSLDISLTNSTTAAGIGGAYYDPNGKVGDFSCGMVVINGGTITAAGRDYSVGIGGASYAPNFGNGGNITITGGHVTATGSDGAPGIGGGKGSDNDGSLTLSSADVLDNSTTLGSKGTYTINGDPTEDMIVVPEGLVYTGQALDVSGIRINDSKTGTAEYFGQTFRVQASADGWELQDLGEVKESGTYTAVFKKGDKTISKTFTVKQSGTDLTSEGKVLTYNGDTQTTTFTADDNITVKATPTATGQAPANSAMFTASLAAPAAGQMAVFVGDTQVSVPVDAADGTYTMTVSAADVLLAAGGPGTGITLTAKFVANNNMADAAGTVNVNISAVAKVVNGNSTIYVGNLDDAFKKENDGAIITLLTNVTRTGSEYLLIGIDCTLDLGGHTIFGNLDVSDYILTIVGKNVTIQGDGGISGTGDAQVLQTSGNVIIKGGTFSCESGNCIFVTGSNASLSITDPKVRVENTGGYGLCIGNASSSVQLSSGTYFGEAGAIFINGSNAFTLGGLLAHSGDTRYAYFDESGIKPITGKLDDKELTGTVTVKKCDHTGEGVCRYTHATGTTTHQQTCLACGETKTSENCSYVDGECACGSTLSVVLTGAERLVYNGKAHEPGVTVTLDGTKLTETDYGVTYTDNINAGTDTATVTVKGKENYSFEIKKTFSIEKAEQKDFAVVAESKPYKKNGTFTLSTNGGGGDGAVLYRVPENNGVLMVNGNTATIIGVGTVTVTATKAGSDNYKEATATGKITIGKATAPVITYPMTGSITYGQKLSDCALTGGSTEYGTFAWKEGGTVPAVGDTTGYTVVFTASEETEKNYETITNTTQKVSVKVEQAVPAVGITAAVSGSKDNRQAVLTVNVAKAGAGAFPTGTVKLTVCTGSTEVEIETVTLNSSGTASYTWDGLLDQTYTIKAVYTGDGNYKKSGSREFTFDAAKQNQQDFALEAIGAKTYGDAAITLRTGGGSGSGAVRYESSDEGVIRIEEGRAVITGAGTATITAIKEGDDNYNEASASRNVTVAKKALTVKADSKTVVRGNSMPAFTYRADGLVNGDTFMAVPSITAGVQNTDILGKYDIVINGGTLRNGESYRITYVNGTLHIVERFYIVTVTDGTGGGEYAEGDTVTVAANERSGYTFTGWSGEDGVAFADSKAKTTTFTMPAKSVTVKANYTYISSGGNNGGGSGDGGNSGGSGNNGGGNSGGNENNGGGGSANPDKGNTTPQVSVIKSADTNTNPGNETAPGTGTTPVNTGIGNTARPGAKQPFIKGEDGKIGWDVIRAEEEKAQEGSVINVDMNGSVVVPGDIFDSIKGKDITITFDMGNGILWTVDGKNITTDQAGDIDFSVKPGVKTVPMDIVNNVTGENYSIQLSLAYEGEFGFTAVLSINLGKENAGYTASLYYYNESTGELEFICKDQVAEDGTVSLAFTHASDYVIVIDGEQEERDGAAESVQPENTDQAAGSETEQGGDGMPGSPETGQTGAVWWIVVILLLAAASGAGVFVAVKKKGR